MHIKHLTLMSGPAGCFQIGHVREVSEQEAAGLIAGGYAIEVKPPQPETATARRGEAATTAEQDAAKHLANIKASGRTGKAKKVTPPAEVPAAVQAETPAAVPVETPAAAAVPPASTFDAPAADPAAE